MYVRKFVINEIPQIHHQTFLLNVVTWFLSRFSAALFHFLLYFYRKYKKHPCVVNSLLYVILNTSGMRSEYESLPTCCIREPIAILFTSIYIDKPSTVAFYYKSFTISRVISDENLLETCKMKAPTQCKMFCLIQVWLDTGMTTEVLSIYISSHTKTKGIMRIVRTWQCW